MAAAQATRALPNLVTVVAWRSCDHTGPVFEGDVLGTALTVEARASAGAGRAGGPARADHADRGDEEPVPVLDWRFVGVMA